MKNEKNFFIVVNDDICLNLDPYELKLYIIFSLLSIKNLDGENIVECSVSFLCKASNIGKTKVCESIKSLEEKYGLIKRIKETGSINTYVILKI